MERFAPIYRVLNLAQGFFDIIRSYHHQSGISIEALTADSARTRVMVLISAHDKTEATPKVSITLAGVYHDEWRKTPEGWRFARRTLKV